MPRDNMTSLIQKIARQALITFRNPSAISDSNKVFLENQSKLHSLLTQVRAADLHIVPRKIDSSPVSVPHNPPVTYMHICETDAFSMGVFLLKTGTSIPLHDHPGMNGMLKVIYGKVRISCFDKMDKLPDASSETQFSPPLLPFQRDSLRRSLLSSVGEYTEESGPCILTPHKDNLHQVDAVDGPTAFLDILAPPYDPDDGRDCHYYRVLKPVSEGLDKKSSSEEQREMWLLEIPQPSDFWCGGEPYPGPEVSL
ncbi:2-aminoethanethiol (cysteamine) dioxygenase b [Megalops cyprinoides]|uniref:2-aminoethanethiol (cysteamine) dioxygenase b n=1 Tax=Megalops cyprinoides TaxID=118141 RepID=UPI001864306A|nr:2-aminoethanethiol (cysteamine) dioxygenase b [Megalops cyprinoides]